MLLLLHSAERGGRRGRGGAVSGRLSAASIELQGNIVEMKPAFSFFHLAHYLWHV